VRQTEKTERMMMTNAQLVEHYQNLLKKIQVDFPTDTDSSLKNERNQEYVDHAKENLKAVENGRTW